MNRDSVIAPNVPCLGRIRTGGNIQVKFAGEVTDTGNMRAVKPLGSKYAEIVFGDKSSEVFERVRHEYLLLLPDSRILPLIHVDLAPGEGFEPPRPKGPQALQTVIHGGLKACAYRPTTMGR